MSKSIPLINSKLFAIVDDEDYEKVSSYTWYKLKGRNTYYARNASQIFLHTIILQSSDPELTVDHIDGNGLNNLRENLRLATFQQQAFNRKKHTINTTSGYKGVSFDKLRNSWRPTINVNQKTIHLGSYKTEDGAARAYNRAARQYFGEFAVLNEIPKIQEEVQ